MSAGNTAVNAPVGLMINNAPTNAMMVVIISNLFGISFRINIESIIAKNGDSLLSIFASAIPSLSTA